MLQSHKLIIVLLNVDFLFSVSSFLVLVLASPLLCPATNITVWCVALKALQQYTKHFSISISHDQIHIHTHKVKVQPVNIQHTHTHIFRSACTSTYSAHTPQYSLALATDDWQFMLTSMNTEFIEKVLRAMKTHWLTKQHTKQKKEDWKEANPKF